MYNIIIAFVIIAIAGTIGIKLAFSDSMKPLVKAFVVGIIMGAAFAAAVWVVKANQG